MESRKEEPQTHDLTAASIVELRAEILRKRHEFERERETGGALEGKPRAASWLKPTKKSAKLAPSSPPTLAPSYEEAEAWEKSRKALEAKSNLYDKLKRGETQMEDAEVLVDFDRKGWSDDLQKYIGVQEPEEHAKSGIDFLERTFKDRPQEKGELIEYVDEFGRTRMVRPEQLRQLQEEREEMLQLLTKHKETNHDQSPIEKTLQEEENDSQPAGPVHYDPSMEIRTRGIGFFDFSQEEGLREQQLRALRELRNSTVEARTRALIVREQRRLRIASRMARIQERRKQFQIGPSSKEKEDGLALDDPAII